jgi:FkbM family methyltransferase
MYFLVNKANNNNNNFLKLKILIKIFCNFFFNFKFIRINFFYHLKKYKDYNDLNSKNLNSQSVVLDFGANVGMFSLYISDIYNSKLYAYEPNPNCVNYLKKLFYKNKKVKIFNKGVSNKSERLKLYFSENDKKKIETFDGCSFDGEKKNIDIKNYSIVKTVDIKKILSKHKQIDLLKIDIEGWEYKIINFILKNINKIKYIYIEFHISSNKQKKNYNKILKVLKSKKLLNRKIFLWH